jgi:hypothetical protein
MTKQEAIKELELIFRMADRCEELADSLSDRTFGLVMQPFYAAAAQVAIENDISEDEMEAIEVRTNAAARRPDSDAACEGSGCAAGDSGRTPEAASGLSGDLCGGHAA